MSINHLLTFVSGACVGGYLAYTYMDAVKNEQLRKERQEKHKVANRCLYVLKYGLDLYPETSSDDSLSPNEQLVPMMRSTASQSTQPTQQSTQQPTQQTQQQTTIEQKSQSTSQQTNIIDTSTEVKANTQLSNKYGMYINTTSFPVHAILGYSDVSSHEPTVLKKDTTETSTVEPSQVTTIESTTVIPQTSLPQTSFVPVSTVDEKTSTSSSINIQPTQLVQHNQSELLSTPSSTSTEIQTNNQKLESEEKAHTIYLMALEKLTR